MISIERTVRSNFSTLRQPGDASSNDYCSESLCEGVKHIACNNTGVSYFWARLNIFTTIQIARNSRSNVHQTQSRLNSRID